MPINNAPGTLSATRYAGSQPIAHDASKLTTGTIARERVPLTITGFIRTGTFKIGSVRTPTTSTEGLAFSQRGHLWLSESSLPYVFQYGTLALRAGTNSRIGTQRIGSFKSPATFPTGISFDARGHLWHSDVIADYLYQIGTLGLRAGTNSRIGTQRIGSVRTPAGNPRGVGFSKRGHLWLTDATTAYFYQLGTLGLRAGTNSRIGTQRIGSVRTPVLQPTEFAFSQRGHIWHIDPVANYFYQIGTLGLRAGTNSRIGTQQIGSVGVPIGTVAGITFNPRGDLWSATTGFAGRLFSTGTADLLRRVIARELPSFANPRKVAISVRLAPGVMLSSGVALTQTRQGTISSANVAGGGPVLDQVVVGKILPEYGSWRVRSIGGTVVTIRKLSEWQLRRS